MNFKPIEAPAFLDFAGIWFYVALHSGTFLRVDSWS